MSILSTLTNFINSSKTLFLLFSIGNLPFNNLYNSCIKNFNCFNNFLLSSVKEGVFKNCSLILLINDIKKSIN